MLKTHAKKLRWLIVIIIVVIIGLLFWGITWATYARPPLPEAVAALESDNLVEVGQEPWLTFSPAQTVPTTGFIFYPGGRIDPQGYAPLMNELASGGYLVVVPEMPINMAVFNPNIADEIMANYPDISRWVISGHSVGGTMAAQYTSNNREVIDGLAIWASYPAASADLSDIEIPVVVVYGSDDPGVNGSEVSERKHLLPEHTLYVRIEGGDHHQFGSYVIKSDEDHATIERDSQHAQIIRPTLDLLDSVSDAE
jgi:predicted esterase